VALLPQVWEVFAPGQWKNRQKDHLLQYRILGLDGAGNPICVQEVTGEVWLLDHEGWFHSGQFINSSIAQLAECLLAYMGESDADSFSNAVQRLDPRALREGNFWWFEAAGLREVSS